MRTLERVPKREGPPSPLSDADPQSAEALIEEARQRQRWRRQTALMAALVLLVGSVVVVVFGSTRHPRSHPISSPVPRQKLVAPPMPPQIVVWTNNFKIEVLSSRSGQVVRTLATGVEEIRGLPTLAASPSEVLYFDNASGTGEEILRVPLAGGPVTDIAQGRMPAISPNGALLAYVTYTDLTDAPEAIVVMDLRSGARQSWAFTTSHRDITSLAWSPDGGSLSFNSVQGATPQVLELGASSGPLDDAPTVPLPPGVQWAGYLSSQTGVGVAASTGRINLVRVAVSDGRLLGPLTSIQEPLATANSLDGAEGTVQAAGGGHYLLISGSGAGTGEILQWTVGTHHPVRVAPGLRAVWAGASTKADQS